MMAIAPQLVKPQKKVGKYVSQGYMIVADPERSMPDGFVGDAPAASAELGRAVKFIHHRPVDRGGKAVLRGGMNEREEA